MGRLLGEAFAPILGAAQEGEGWAFARLWRELAPLVRGYASLRGSEEPDDLTSEVFLQAFRGIGGFTGEERAFRSWILTIAHRRLVDARRQRSRRLTTVGGTAALQHMYGGDAESEAMAALGRARVVELVHRLPDDQRDVLLLRILADLTIEQVADVLGKTAGAVKALQRRGLTHLRKILAEEGVPL